MAVSLPIIPETRHRALLTVEGVRPNKQGVRDTADVEPVDSAPWMSRCGCCRRACGTNTIRSCQQRAEYGTTARERTVAARELAVEQARQQLQAGQAAAQAVIDDRSGTAEQKDRARADQAEAARLAAAEVEKRTASPRVRVDQTFAAEDRGLLLTRVGAAAPNRHDPGEDAAKHSADMANLLGQLVRHVTQQRPPARQPRQVSVFGGPAT